jgi:CRP-like cAMP-binding protein
VVEYLDIVMNNNLESQLTTFFEKHKLVKYKKGEIIYRSGDIFNHIAFAKSGYIKLYIINSEGQQVTLNLFKPLFFLTMTYATNNLESRYYFEAVTDVEAYRAPKEDVLKFLDNNPEILFEINHTLLKTLEETIFNMGNITLGNSYRKIATIILSLSKQFGEESGHQIRINFSTTHEVLASLTGLTRETAGIQINKLKDEGIIDQEGKFIIIKNLEQLKKISSLDTY